MRKDLAKFDLNLLVAFDTLMTERGVTRAGRALGITQAAMSNTLRRLREIFGDPLFVKSGHRMEPTARALELAGPVSRALVQVRQALEQETFEPAQSEHFFRLGMVDYAATVLLPQLLERLAQVAPGVTIELVDVGGDDEVSILENGGADLVFSRFQWVPTTVLLRRLFQMHYVCLHRPDHPLLKDGFNLEGFLAARHVHYYPRGMSSTVVDEALTQMGRERRIVARTYSLSLVPFMVAESDLICIVPDGTAHYLAKPLGLTVSPLPFKTSPLRLALAWHPRTDKSAPNIWLREEVTRLLATNMDS
ncbi:MAG: LysR family transcriptional regulator [Magnetococcales bacterium]|nr:LysR family transcriptional regulator [Magnetococcales bacterium]